jgi:AraC family transcriptional regulator
MDMTHGMGPAALREPIRTVELEGYILTETVRPSCLKLPRHFHSHTNIAFALKGSFRETIGKTPQVCGPLDLIIRPAGEPHSNEYGHEDVRCLIIEVKPQRLAMIQQVSEVLDRVVHIRGGLMPALAMRIYKEFQIMDSASALSIEALTLEMLARTVRLGLVGQFSSAPRWLHQVRELLHEQFSQQLSLSGVAEFVGVHPAHLAKMFRKHCQCTVGEYIRRLRLEYAVRELTDSVTPLAEIALAAGFYDQSHFTREFKLHNGMTPAEFRLVIRASKSGTKRPRFSKTS